MAVYRAIAEVEGDRIEIRTDWDRMGGSLSAVSVDALARHLGCSHGPEPMRKASGKASGKGEQIDPRLGELAALIEAARSDWQRWGARLTRSVLDLLDDGRAVPLSSERTAELRALFDAHRDALRADWIGVQAVGADRVAQLQRQGLLSLDSSSAAARGGYAALGYQLGRVYDPLTLHQLEIAPKRTRREAFTLAQSMGSPSTADRAALLWARERAGEFVSMAADRSFSRVRSRLADERRAAIGAAVARSIEGRADSIRQDVREAFSGTTAQNDIDRIVSTEVMTAHGYGAYVALKESAAAIGEVDPLCYRTASIGACEHCRRIWGPPTKPIPYRMSTIEQREQTGGNFDLPAAQWGPVFGPVHPNCKCGPVAYYNAEIEPAISRAVDEVLKTFGRF